MLPLAGNVSKDGAEKKATASRELMLQRINSQSSNKSFCPTVRKSLWRTRKVCACFHSANCFASPASILANWFASLLMTTSLRFRFCSCTILSANLAKNVSTRTTALARRAAAASRSAAHNFSSHKLKVFFGLVPAFQCSVLKKYTSKARHRKFLQLPTYQFCSKFWALIFLWLHHIHWKKLNPLKTSLKTGQKSHSLQRQHIA